MIINGAKEPSSLASPLSTCSRAPSPSLCSPRLSTSSTLVPDSRCEDVHAWLENSVSITQAGVRLQVVSRGHERHPGDRITVQISNGNDVFVAFDHDQPQDDRITTDMLARGDIVTAAQSSPAPSSSYSLRPEPMDWAPSMPAGLHKGHETRKSSDGNTSNADSSTDASGSGTPTCFVYAPSKLQVSQQADPAPEHDRGSPARPKIHLGYQQERLLSSTENLSKWGSPPQNSAYDMTQTSEDQVSSTAVDSSTRSSKCHRAVQTESASELVYIKSSAWNDQPPVLIGGGTPPPSRRRRRQRCGSSEDGVVVSRCFWDMDFEKYYRSREYDVERPLVKRPKKCLKTLQGR